MSFCPFNRYQSIDSDADSVITTDLSIEGIGLSTRENVTVSPLWKKITDVLGEVVCLVERLEADRQDAEEAHQKEKRRKRILESKVDSILQWKQQEHPLVVQKEHEACIRDITELKWHLKLECEKVDQVQEKLSHIEALNQRLHEDINFVKKQAPLVKENLDFQISIINRINTAQAEADKAYAKTQDNFRLVEKELEMMELDANNEKASMDHELLGMKNQLANRLDDLNQLKALGEDLCAEIQEAEQSTALTENECAAIAQNLPEKRELEKAISNRILELKAEIQGEMQKTKMLKEKITTLQEEIQKIKHNGEAEMSQLEELLQSKRSALAALCKENMEYQLKVEDYKKTISQSEKAVNQMHKDRAIMLQKIGENDEQWERAREEVTQVVVQHSVIKARLEEQEQLTFMEEERARKVIENLGKELANETAALERLKSRCENITEELHQHQKGSEVVNQKLQKEFEDASSTTKALGRQIEKIKTLAEKLEEIQCQHRNALVNLEREKKLRLEHLNAVKGDHADVIKRYDCTVDRISHLARKCSEYRDASDKMEKIAATLPDVIVELE
ncbi:hypothetical protein LDENG_00113660 [Lucifuga dentata]|nr:hypothetical protein LDENG_00113660 [Lucifuga dentata]